MANINCEGEEWGATLLIVDWSITSLSWMMHGLPCQAIGRSGMGLLCRIRCWRRQVRTYGWAAEVAPVTSRT